jgi:signal transduction histidine kinase
VSDGKRIMQILLNLLSNALKFTQKGFIRISVSSFRHGFEEMVRITVEDTGIGIKEKDQAKLFKSFSMLEDSSNLNTQGKKNAELLFVFNTK